MTEQSSQHVVQLLKQSLQQGRFEQSIEIAEQAIESECPPSVINEILYFKTVALRQLGKTQQGIQSALKIIEHNSQHARAHQELGYLYLQNKDTHSSAAAFYQATQRNPALVNSWMQLIELYKALNNPVASDFAAEQVKHLQTLPREILGARDLFHDGNIQLADQVCRQFLQQNKHHVEAMLLLAEIGIHLKHYAEAEFLLESSIELHPDHYATGREYLKLLAKMGKFSIAKDRAEKLLSKYPDDSTIKLAKASALVGLGELEEAISIYYEALAKNDKQPNVYLLLGHALKAKGDFEQTINAYKKAYQLNPEFGDAYWSLANTKTYQFSTDETARLQSLVSDEEIPIDDRIHMHFALGKALEDANVFDQSFHHYGVGNQLKQSIVNYDASYIERQVEAQIEYMTPSVFERLRGVGITAPDPIFIVGLPRAGSTLLEQILASHSQVDGTMELHNVLGLVSRLRNHPKSYPALLNELAPDYFQRFGQQYLDETKVYREGAPFFIDKMPNNFVHIGLIKLILPNAKIIDARREPMACCFSGFKQLFGEGQEFTYNLTNIGRYYRAYLKMMEHWDKVLPSAVLRVQHEDVIDDLETQVKRILDFCELPFESQCLAFHKTKRVIKTPSSEQVRQPIYRSGMEQWKNFEPFLGELKEVLTSKR